MIIIQAATEMIKKMALEFLPGEAATSTKETGLMEYNTVKVNIFLFRLNIYSFLRLQKRSI